MALVYGFISAIVSRLQTSFFPDIIKLVVISLDYILLLTRIGATFEKSYFKLQQFSVIVRHP